MEYKFTILEKNKENYKVEVNIVHENSVLFEDILIAKYDIKMGMVLLDLDYIKSLINNDKIRMNLITSLKSFIKSEKLD